jgi:polyvinyl alcohol dehydrogenase (cytochrome)
MYWTVGAAVLFISTTVFTARQESGVWPMGGQNPHNTRHAPTEHRLGVHNVSQLTPKWVFTTSGDISATPAVDEQALYVPDWGGNLYKVDAETGQQLWARSIPSYTGISTAVGLLQPVSRTSPALHGNKVLLGSHIGAYVLAVDQHTGDLLWKTQADPHPAAIITQAPVVSGDRLYIGVSSQEELMAGDPGYTCCTFRGSVLALDVNTGRIVWRTYVVPEGYSGGAIWGSTPVVDPKRHALYITTGNNYSAPEAVYTCLDTVGGDLEAAAGCLAPDDYAGSILALDLGSGAIQWGRRLQSFDVWSAACGVPLFNLPPLDTCRSPNSPDYDFGTGANLFTVQDGDTPHDLLGAGQKSGIYWALDPDNGAIVWATQSGPSSLRGGILWGPATDGTRVYVAASNFDGAAQTLIPSGQTITWGFWSALDARTGAILWQTADPVPGSYDAGMVTVANDVVYAGSMDPLGHMYALDATTGAILWSYASGGSVVAGPAVVKGTVYWGSGYARGFGTANNQLYAFALP